MGTLAHHTRTQTLVVRADVKLALLYLIERTETHSKGAAAVFGLQMRNEFILNVILLLFLSAIQIGSAGPDLSGALSPAEPASPVPDGQKEQLCSSAELTSAEISFTVDGDSMRIASVNADSRNCSLRRFEGDQAGALSLLKGKHLVLVGDSITRYQYLSLVTLLETGIYTTPVPASTFMGGRNDWKTWPAFYEVLAYSTCSLIASS
jgi:GDSL/SGNH-like Acyl-Esterase family found in Pmr5 and Cas1p